MAKRKDAGQAPTSVPSEQPLVKLTYKQERFVQEYVRWNGNATRAALEAGYGHAGARTEGARLLANVNIRDAIEIEKERVANIKGVTRELLLDIMIGMALANPGDFDEVLKDPENPENYARLGNKVHAIKSVKSSFKHGNEIQYYDKQKAINDLWDKLGLDKNTSEKDRVSFLERFAQLGEKLGRGGSV
jgi:hypothetical protein